MRVYLAGPMTGIPYHNFPALDAAETDLLARGHEVVPPVDLHDPVKRALVMTDHDGSLKVTGRSWADFLSDDVKLVAGSDLDGVVVLDGWQRSRGALLETFTARLCRIPVYAYDPEAEAGFRFLPDTYVRHFHGALFT